MSRSSEVAHTNSVSAYLTSRSIQHRVIGSVMEFWRTQMPKGMFLKSEGFASSLGDPAGNFTIGSFCAEKGIKYADLGTPVSLETFCAYGRAFQERLVPQLEDQKLVHLARSANGFERSTLETVTNSLPRKLCSPLASAISATSRPSS